MSGKLSLVLVRPAIDRALRLGLRVEDARRRVGLDPSAAVDPEQRVDYEAGMRVWETLAARSAEDEFGLRAALDLEPGDFDLHEFLLRSSDNLGNGFQQFSRFIRLLTTDR